MTPPKVLLVSGHMIDKPDRESPRFPPSEVPRVTRQVEAALREWGVGPETTVICGAARGADLIAAERAHALGARIKLVLARPADDHVEKSVDLPGTDWAQRFRHMLTISDVQELSGTAEDVYGAANDRMIELGRETARRESAELLVLLIWNGRTGDGEGGTRDVVAKLGFAGPGPHVRVIDPTPRAYESRQFAEGPKRLLSLDGGGIRGVITLEVLDRIEQLLRRHYGNDDLVLADYFDYIAGTSTGAIIATALALGKPIREVKLDYQRLGRQVFKKRLLPMQGRSLYRDKPLRTQIEAFIGGNLTLGDPSLRSLLLIVMQNTKTDSPWPLSNCTEAKYNRADRNLLSVPDRNLDIGLAPLVRASTAAPVYFAPEEIVVGRHRFLFQDGGITPFNNPALLQFTMATLPAYGLSWPTGATNMLVVSVGTGSSPAAHPDLKRRQVNLPFNARNLPAVFMNGAALGQDLLCRSLGTCRFGPELDREVGTLVGSSGVAGSPLFTYVRYDADLSDEKLRDAGITDRKAQKQVRKLDAVDRLKELQHLGRRAATDVDLEEHFADFLGPLHQS